LYLYETKQQKQNKMENVINHTNARLANWYSNVKREYNIDGSGFAKFNNETNEVEIHYTENGVNYIFKHYFHSDFNIDTIFNIWQTEANPETDKI